MRFQKIILHSLLLFLCLSATAQTKSYLIGIADTYSNRGTTVPRTYIEAIIRAGNVPVVIPFMTDENKLQQLIQTLDGIVLPGGEDIEPARYGETASPQLGTVNMPRDSFDVAVLRLAVENRLPVLGICRGQQMINVFFGGTLYQDIPTAFPESPVVHLQTVPRNQTIHAVQFTPDAKLVQLMGTDSVGVNSFHHQSVKELAPGLKITGVSPDGIVEAIEHETLPIVAVQFHPEGLAVGCDSVMTRIFGFMELFQE